MRPDAQQLIAGMFPAAPVVRGMVPDSAVKSDPINDPGLLAEVQDHWWVQAGSDGQWHDYDPLLLEGAEGRPPAATTIDPAELPADLRHSVTLRVVIERLEEGELVEEVPLAYSVPMGSGEPGKLGRLDFRAWVPPEDVDVANETADAVEGARLSSAWRPRLSLDGETVNGEWFSEEGRIGEPGGLAQADALSGGLDALGGLGAEPAEQDAVESTLSAAWLEYETAGPGIEPRTARRGPLARCVQQHRHRVARG